MSQFIADHKTLADADRVPFYEDAAEQKIAGFYTSKSVRVLQNDIVALLTKLGGAFPQFLPGRFPHSKGVRYGFQIAFMVGGTPARIDCAALPIRKETSIKKDRALAMALYLLRCKLEADFNGWVYAPGSIPLLPYLIGGSGLTVTEEIRSSGNVALLGAGQ